MLYRVFYVFAWLFSAAEHLPHLCETSGIQDLSKRTAEQRLVAIADAIVSMGQNINQFYKDVKYRYQPFLLNQTSHCGGDDSIQCIATFRKDPVGRLIPSRMKERDLNGFILLRPPSPLL